MKTNAPRYGVDPEMVVLGGGSAGGHLGLLAGYTPGLSSLRPEELKDTDLSVCGIISFYGPTDLLATYHHENQKLFTDFPPVPIGEKLESNNRYNLNPEILTRLAGRLDILLGGHPQEVPGMFDLASAIFHVHAGSPPTLLIQGQPDFITPVDATCELYTKLVESGVPAINIVFPLTEHGFDLLIPHIAPLSPPAQSALYDVDRFLALLSNK